MLRYLPNMADERLLVGLNTSDDAAVYKLDDNTALISTLDFFTPVVDDPYDFGQIAAANAVSDVYAMGGTPFLALNIACFPACLPLEMLGRILQGGAEKIVEAGAVIAGGHSIDDDEPKYGLAVLGKVDPEKIVLNSGAKPGDLLILTKPLGSGIINTAIKGGLADKDTEARAISLMASLNRMAAEAMVTVGVNACTDITGFGFLGHAVEMARGSKVTLQIDSAGLPIIENTIQFADMGLIPGGAYSNREYLLGEINFVGKIDRSLEIILFDPQTSGGLLISVPEAKASRLINELTTRHTQAAVVGRVADQKEYPIEVL